MPPHSLARACSRPTPSPPVEVRVPGPGVSRRWTPTILSRAHARAREGSDDAGRLFGAADALRESIGIDNDPAKEIVSEQRSAARDTLGNSAFEDAHTEGRLLEPEEACLLALSCLD